MRHGEKRHRLGKPADQRKALLRSLTTELFKHGQILTTEARAKAVQPEVEKMITLGKRGDLHARRLAEAWLLEADVTKRLFAEVAPQYAERHGGYTRVVKAPPRLGDAAPMAVIQLV